MNLTIIQTNEKEMFYRIIWETFKTTRHAVFCYLKKFRKQEEIVIRLKYDTPQ